MSLVDTPMDKGDNSFVMSQWIRASWAVGFRNIAKAPRTRWTKPLCSLSSLAPAHVPPSLGKGAAEAVHPGGIVEGFVSVLGENESAYDANMANGRRSSSDADTEVPVHLPLERYALDLAKSGDVAPAKGDLRCRCDIKGRPPCRLDSRQGTGLKAALRKERFECLMRQVGEVIAGVEPFDAELGPAVIQKACDEPFRLLLDGKMRSEMVLQIVEASEGKEAAANGL